MTEPALTFGPRWLPAGSYTLSHRAEKESSRAMELDTGQEDTKGTTEDTSNGQHPVLHVNCSLGCWLRQAQGNNSLTRTQLRLMHNAVKKWWEQLCGTSSQYQKFAPDQTKSDLQLEPEQKEGATLCPQAALGNCCRSPFALGTLTAGLDFYSVSACCV